LNIKKIAVLTGGGDAPGENACLYAATHAAKNLGIEIVGLRNGWDGAINYFERPLYEHELWEHIGDAGTYIGTSRVNPFKDGSDKSEIIVNNLKKNNVDALIPIGGEDTLDVAVKLLKKYPNIVGVAKTMDYDIQPYSLGFNSAVENGRDFIDELRTTAYSHDRVMVCELFGRHVGWVALKAGITGRADVILIPEVEADIDVVCDVLKRKIEERKTRNEFKKGYGIVVVAEGLKFGENINKKEDDFGHRELKGVGDRIAKHIETVFKDEYGLAVETKSVKPEHSIRGGRTSCLDIDMGFKYGLAAVEYVKNKMFRFAPTVDTRTEGIEPMLLEEVIKPKKVPEHLIQLYEGLVSFGA
jgi:6-phosphofructokinase 1